MTLHSHMDEHIHEVLAVQNRPMSDTPELIAVTKRVAGVTFEQQWRENLVDKAKDGNSCQTTGQSTANRGAKCY